MVQEQILNSVLEIGAKPIDTKMRITASIARFKRINATFKGEQRQ